MRDGRQLRICVYAISKNEAKFVERFCDSARQADLILIADTGSTDDTVMRAVESGAVVEHIRIHPWRFDDARNACLSLIPDDIDVCISLDLDEVMVPGWREEIELVWSPETTRLRYMYDWGSGSRFKYEKIHSRYGYRWKHTCHEVPVPDPRIQEKWVDTDKLLVQHLPDNTKSRGQYLDLLRISINEDPMCPRNAFYFARELTFYGEWSQAVESLKKYLAMPAATWNAERSYAYRLLGNAYSELGRRQDSETSHYMACMEAPDSREPWCSIAMFMYFNSRWPECYAYCIRALSITRREPIYTEDPAVWGHWPHDLASISAWHMGMWEESLKHAEIAVEKTPDDHRLQANLKFVSEHCAKVTV